MPSLLHLVNLPSGTWHPDAQSTASSESAEWNMASVDSLASSHRKWMQPATSEEEEDNFTSASKY